MYSVRSQSCSCPETTSSRSRSLLRAGSLGSRRLLALVRGLLLVVAVQAVLVDVVDDLVGNVVADALAALAEEADLGRGDVVLDELRDHADLFAELLEADKRVIWNILVEVKDL
jgi:hypothetical protein